MSATPITTTRRALLVLGHPQVLPRVKRVLDLVGLKDARIDALGYDGGLTGCSRELWNSPSAGYKAIWHVVQDPRTIHMSRAQVRSYRSEIEMLSQGDDLCPEWQPPVPIFEDAHADALYSWCIFNLFAEAKASGATINHGVLSRRAQIEDHLWPQELCVSHGLEWSDRVRVRVEEFTCAEPRLNDWPFLVERVDARVMALATEMAMRYGYDVG